MLKKIVIVCFFYLFNMCFSYGYIDEDLTYLESLKYGETFNNEDYGSRLRRLETDFLGMSQSGDLENRIKILKQVSDNSYISNSVMPSYSKAKIEKQGKIRKFLDDLSPSFLDSGYVTGYTPPISSSFDDDFFNDDLMGVNNNSMYCNYNNWGNSLFNPFNSRLQRNLNNFQHNIERDLNRKIRRNIAKNTYDNGRYWERNKYRKKRHSSRPFNHYNKPYTTRYNVPTSTMRNVATRSSVKILHD